MKFCVIVPSWVLWQILPSIWSRAKFFMIHAITVRIKAEKMHDCLDPSLILGILK